MADLVKAYQFQQSWVGPVFTNGEYLVSSKLLSEVLCARRNQICVHWDPLKNSYTIQSYSVILHLENLRYSSPPTEDRSVWPVAIS